MAGGVLYVVATPIGNLEDVTLRALRVLREVDVVAAEDTRRTRVLLTHHGIDRPLVSYHDAVERTRAPRLVAQMREGRSIALVSDAGTPSIADPGLPPGARRPSRPGSPSCRSRWPSAVAALVSVAGVPSERFAFEGFLPSRAGRPPRAPAGARGRHPRDGVPGGADAARGLPRGPGGRARRPRGRTRAASSRSSTRSACAGRCRRFAATSAAMDPVRGECVLLVTGATEAGPAAAIDVDARIRTLRAEGLGTREIAARLAHETGRTRRECYQRVLALADHDD